MFCHLMPHGPGPEPLVLYHMGKFNDRGVEYVCTMTMTYLFGPRLAKAYAGYRLNKWRPEAITIWSPLAEPYCSIDELLEVLVEELSACSEVKTNAAKSAQALHRQAFAHLDDLLVTHVGITWLKRVYANDSLRRQLPKACSRLEELLEREAQSRMLDCKARRIQQHWRRIVADPYHQVCRRRLEREFSHLGMAKPAER